MDANQRVACCLRSALAAALLGLAPGAPAAVTTVYKCFDRNLGVLYTDAPCKGEQLDIDAGLADPNAVAELARERAALSRAVAQRIADHRRYPVVAPDYAIPPPLPEPEVYYPAGLGYYAPYGDNRASRRGHNSGGGDNNRGRATRSVPAITPNGIANRTFR